MKSTLRVRLLSIALIAILLLGAKNSPLMRLTIRNKSGQQIAVRLTKADLSRFYYLTVPAGDSLQPKDVTFTIAKDVYQMRVFYFLTTDPMTGYECKKSRHASLFALKDIRVTVTPCYGAPPTRGEPSMVKMGRWRCVR